MTVFKTLIVSLAILFGTLSLTSPVLAYTGMFAVQPPLLGGPSHVTVTNFNVNTRANNPQMIVMNLTHLYGIQIETDPTMTAPILIKEYPDGSDKAFDIIVPQKLQDALVEATIYIWAPDADNLVIEHDHVGAPLVYETATKVSPQQTNDDGEILWSITVDGFSSFTPLNSNFKLPKSNLKITTILNLAFLIIVALGAPLALIKNKVW